MPTANDREAVLGKHLPLDRVRRRAELLTHCTDDALIQSPSQLPVAGTDALRAFWTAAFDRFWRGANGPAATA